MDRQSEMSVFVQGVDAESFSTAARTMTLTPYAVSKLVSRLKNSEGADPSALPRAQHLYDLFLSPSSLNERTDFYLSFGRRLHAGTALAQRKRWRIRLFSVIRPE